MIRSSGLFDTAWYHDRYPDVGADTDPIVHYLKHGASERRDPSASFSTKIYLCNYPDVIEAGVNPLVHYIEFGRFENRTATVALRPGADYQTWLEHFERTDDRAVRRFFRAIDLMPRRPLISVVMPVFNTEREWLVPAIESVLKQLYPNWELCISDNASTEPHVREILEHYKERDSRVRVVYRDANGHISANSNSALALATGEFVALMDSDDELPRHALFWVAKEIIEHPDVELIFSDEDKIDASGARYDAYFKSDWNPALMLSQNMFSHLGVYRRSLVEKVGGFRLGLEGSQDHDLVLRCADETTPARIRHIPRILYHWRAIPGSTASSEAGGAKPYAWRAGAQAIEDHLRRKGVDGHVEQTSTAYYQVRYAKSRLRQKVSIIIPTACKLELLTRCITTILASTTYPDYEIVLVVNEIRFKNKKKAAYLKSLQAEPRIRILVYTDRPFNYSWINNWAIGQVDSTILCLMNDDISVITPDWLEQLVMRVELEGVAAAGPMLYYPDERIQHAGVTLGINGVAGANYSGAPRGAPGYFSRAALEQDVSCVTAALMVLRREAFEAISGFDENLAVAFNDVDLCIRIREAGWRIIWTPQVEMYHHESATIGQPDSVERRLQFNDEIALMQKKWRDVLPNDPFHNPNLSLFSHHFALADQPRIDFLPSIEDDMHRRAGSAS